MFSPYTLNKNDLLGIIPNNSSSHNWQEKFFQFLKLKKSHQVTRINFYKKRILEDATINKIACL
jgi:hypothetical protein